MRGRIPQGLFVALLVLVSVLVPTAGVLAQEDEPVTNETEGNETDGGDALEDEPLRGERVPGQAVETGEENVTEEGIGDRAFPAREGAMEGPQDAEEDPGERQTDEIAEVGSESGAAFLTISVIVVSLLVGFAVAAASGRRR